MCARHGLARLVILHQVGGVMHNRFWPVVCAVCDKEDEPCYALLCRSFQKPLEEVDWDWENWGGHLSFPTFLINFSAPHLGLQMEWISSTLSENNHTFLVCCGLWHEKPTFVAFCALMCPQNHRCGLVVASRTCFPCKIASRSEDHSEFSSL